jgi:hypothetical protein
MEINKTDTVVQETSQPMTTTSPDIAIKIGDVYCDVDVSKTPYLPSFVHFQACAQPQSEDQTSSLVHSY